MSGDGLRDEIAAAIADHTARCSCCPTIDEPVKLANWLVPTVKARIDAAREQVAEPEQITIKAATSRIHSEGVDLVVLTDAALAVVVSPLIAERDAAVARAEAAERQLYELCVCGKTPMTYDGPQRDCPIHGEPDKMWTELEARTEAAEQAVQRVRDTVAEHRISFQPGAVIQISHIEAALDVTCCDLHNRNCEPPSELCCGGCTERNHPNHPPGERCVMATLDGTP